MSFHIRECFHLSLLCILLLRHGVFIKGACACVLKGFRDFAPHRIFCYQRITKHVGAYRPRQAIADSSSFKGSELNKQLHKEILHSLYPQVAQTVPRLLIHVLNEQL